MDQKNIFIGRYEYYTRTILIYILFCKYLLRNYNNELRLYYNIKKLNNNRIWVSDVNKLFLFLQIL